MNALLKKYPQFLMIPNMISLMNFFCGFISILMAAHGELLISAWLILVALIFDSLDGNIARIFNHLTPLGRELDSLADLTSFVIAPAFLAITFLWAKWGAVTGLVIFFYLACGIFRLARFNTRIPVDGHFEGLPVPAASMLVVMTLLACLRNGWNDHHSVASFLFLTGAMMVSKIPYPKVSALPVSQWRILLISEILVGMIIFRLFNLETSFAALIFVYVFFAPVLHPAKRSRKGAQKNEC